MNKIIVIADDITGAAEIAGIAHRYGLKTKLSLPQPLPRRGEGEADVHVIATDARSYGEEEAARLTKEALSSLPLEGGTRGVFHKVDSALRGNVKAQIEAILSSPLGGNEGSSGCLYMPANPSKGRIIKDGTYYISSPPGGNEGGFIPLHETDFRFDPEFPAWSSRLDERFPGLEYANAETKADVDHAVETALAEGKLLVGAADLFCSFIEHVHGLSPTPPQPFGGLPANASMLIVQGSTQSRIQDLGLSIESMPLDVFYEQAPPATWAARIIDRYQKSFKPSSSPSSSPLGGNEGGHGNEGGRGLRSVPGAILTIGDKEVRPGKHAAVYLRNAMAEVCCALVAAEQPNELIIEGGATAFAIMSQLPYTTFRVVNEIAPGVVRLSSTDEGGKALYITLKPGSYSWGGAIFR